MWILRDLSNGDGADGRPWPDYIWCYPTMALARKTERRHKSKPTRYATLGPIEHRSDEEIARRYEIVNIAKLARVGCYLVRRER
jgi:hypothetical protein